MVFAIASFHIFRVAAVGYLGNAVFKRKSKSEFWRDNDLTIFRGISYSAVCINNAIDSVANKIRAVVELITLIIVIRYIRNIALRCA